MDNQELLSKITEKKEFSDLPKEDIMRILEKYNSLDYGDEEKIKSTRDFLRKIYSSFLSRKLLVKKDVNVEWVLKKHKSTKERYPYYDEIYSKLKQKFKSDSKINFFDFGSGVNGFSVNFLRKYFKKFSYIGVEAVGQLVNLTNFYFKSNFKKEDFKAIHLSLFDIKKLKKIISAGQGKKIVFLFKVIDALESAERNYSKKLLLEISPFVDYFVLSFATRSLGKRSSLAAKRKWLLDFISVNFLIIDDFSFFGERYLIFRKK